MRMNGDVLLVGSIPGSDAEDAMRVCAQGIGDHLPCIPDGETGFRKIWINFLASQTYDGNPALHTLNRPSPVDSSDPNEWRAPDEGWVPRGYDDHWQFRIKDGANLQFSELGYAKEARLSYASFTQLKAEGLLGPEVRFMVAMPLAESATRPFTASADDFPVMMAAYEEAAAREIESMLNDIPAGELVIQWDICMEVLAIECDDSHEGIFPWRPVAKPFDRYLQAVTRAAGFVPDEVAMGLHLCYGDLGHRHLIEPPDLSNCVSMANAAHAAITRPIDFYHVPVPKDRADDAYFEALSGLEIGDGRLYIGLVHHTDGIEGSLARLDVAKRHARNFGVATECGFGRRPRDTIAHLLEIHRAVAEAL